MCKTCARLCKYASHCKSWNCKKTIKKPSLNHLIIWIWRQIVKLICRQVACVVDSVLGPASLKSRSEEREAMGSCQNIWKYECRQNQGLRAAVCAVWVVYVADNAATCESNVGDGELRRKPCRIRSAGKLWWGASFVVKLNKSSLPKPRNSHLRAKWDWSKFRQKW